jgi:hypothetical protein
MRRSLPLLLGLAAPLAAQAVPLQYAHQGRLLDADGLPLEDTLGVTFRLVDDETSGATV